MLLSLGGRESEPKQTNESTLEAGNSSRAMHQVWVAGPIPKSKEEGAGLLYDEPDRAMNHMDAATWPPKFVELSSAWVYRVVRNEGIPHTTCYTTWPTTFGNRAGLRSMWKNKGRAARDYNEEEHVTTMQADSAAFRNRVALSPKRQRTQSHCSSTDMANLSCSDGTVSFWLVLRSMTSITL